MRKYCIPLLVLLLINCQEAQPPVSSDEKTQQALYLFKDVKEEARLKGLITAEQMAAPDEDFGRLAASAPDSAIQYVTQLRQLVEAGTLRGWPPQWPPSLPDSVLSVQSKIAFASIGFGVTEKEFYELPEQERDAFQTIGRHSYFLFPSFDHRDRLYLLQIKGGAQGGDAAQAVLKEEVNNLVDVFKSLYGSPNYLTTHPDILSLKPGGIAWMRSWMVGNKTIKIGVGCEQSGVEYFSICWIYDEVMLAAEQAKANKPLTRKR